VENESQAAAPAATPASGGSTKSIKVWAVSEASPSLAIATAITTAATARRSNETRTPCAAREFGYRSEVVKRS
jgi:hypothetical protein